MKNLQDYITRYSNVANKLGYTGESVDILVQLLAQATYISEVENVTYMTEASLDKAALMNSKIQHCVDVMYSVFRGSCPRVILKVRPTKYLNFKPYDTIITSNNFTIQYLAYGKPDRENISGDKKDIEWNYDSKTFLPAISDEDEWYILGFIAPKRVGENLVLDNEVKGKIQISSSNKYYVECTANNLSDDMYVEIVQTNGDSEKLPRTRIFAEHVLKHSIFDLTLPGWGSRLYLANYFNDLVGRDSRSIEGITENTQIHAQFYGYSELDEYNQAELKRIQLKGAELVDFSEEDKVPYDNELWGKGIYYISAIPRDELNTIHYKANRERYVSSIIRSNSDVGTVLEEEFPDTVMNGGTSYLFTGISSGTKNSTLNIYYIPKEEDKILSSSDIENFINTKRSYYITTNLTINQGIKYFANFTVDLEVYNNSSEDWKEEIEEKILKNKFDRQFNVDFSDLKEIESLISKNSNIKKVLNLSVSFTDEGGTPIDINDIDTAVSYFVVGSTISSSVKV